MYTTFNKVIVGFDGSTKARQALHWGINQAALWHAPLEVLVAGGDYVRGTAEAVNVYREWARDWVREAEQLLNEASVTGWNVTLSSGSPRTVLTDASTPSTIVVVGSRGHGLSSGVLLGSVSQHLARYAAGPVVVVRRDEIPESGPVLVGVDGSRESQRALDFGLAHANASGLALMAIYGWDASLRVGTPLAGDVPDKAAHDIQDADRWLVEAISGRSELYPDLKVECAAIPRPPAAALIDASATAGLLVVGSRGRGTVQELFLGSVSQEVLRKAECPVAIVH